MIQKSVERETTEKMNILSDKLAKSVSSQLLEAMQNIIGTQKSRTYDTNRHENKQESNEDAEPTINSSEMIVHNTHEKQNNKEESSTTRDMLEALPTLEPREKCKSLIYDTTQERKMVET